jgi:hypothetical protein
MNEYMEKWIDTHPYNTTSLLFFMRQSNVRGKKWPGYEADHSLIFKLRLCGAVPQLQHISSLMCT